MSSEKEFINSTKNSSPVLCVDLDGTLLATDVLWESVLLLIKQQPLMIFLLPFWLFRGKAYLKRQIARRVTLDAACLPYRQDVLEFLRQEKLSGRKLVLATASDSEAVKAIAEHLGIFDEVLASDGVLNLSSHKKSRALDEHFGQKRYDYIGNSRVDLPLWQSANAALLVTSSRRLINKASRSASVRHIFPVKNNGLRTILKALRVYQWVKNVLIFVPLIVSHKVFDGELLLKAICGFIAFSLCASSVYVLNDLSDLQADRQHPRKKFRPFAAGTLSVPRGVVLLTLLFSSAFILSLATLPLLFTATLLFYFITTTSYSFYLKRIAVMDIVILAGLYTLRVLAGGIAVDIQVSTWLLAFSMFLFLSLAFMKRYAEMRILQTQNQERAAGRGYLSSDMQWLGSMGGSSGYLSVLVLALYISSKDVEILYRHPKVLWLVCPLLLYWITKMWALAYRGEVDDDPIVVTIKEPISYVVGAFVAIIMLVAL